MDGTIAAQEKAYWLNEVQERSLDVDAARTRGDAPHVVVAAELRLREAKERIAAMED